MELPKLIIRFLIFCLIVSTACSQVDNKLKEKIILDSLISLKLIDTNNYVVLMGVNNKESKLGGLEIIELEKLLTKCINEYNQKIIKNAFNRDKNYFESDSGKISMKNWIENDSTYV